MKKAFWFAAGVGAGLYAALRGRRFAGPLTADGMKDRAKAAAHGLRMLRDEAAQGMADREAELREWFGVTRQDDENEDGK